jgi:two-component system chemotaxis sensor kinase CheA
MSDPALLEIFQGEAREVLQHIEEELIQLEEMQGQDSSEIVGRLFRYYHTLKGSSGIVGLTNIYEFTHKIENLLDLVRSGELEVSTELIDLLLKSLDWMQYTIFGGDVDVDAEGLKKALLDQINFFSAVETEKVLTKSRKTTKLAQQDKLKSYFRIKITFRPDIFEFGIDPLMIIEDLLQLGHAAEMHVYRKAVPLISDIDAEKCYISWLIILETEKTINDINNVFLFVMDDNDIAIEDLTGTYEKDFIVDSDHEPKLGDILVQKGIVSENELEEVIEDQQESNRKLGELIVEKGYASEKDLKAGLGIQKEIQKKLETTTVRVNTAKLDNLLNLLGEIVIGQSTISRHASELGDEQGASLKNALFGLDRITREFQEQIMSIRMIPIGASFNQFKRFVRDTAKSLGKEIRLELKGEETEFDKTVIERIGDPLKHMIRNAIDHGIESKEERIKSGKRAAGTIMLNAYHQEGNVFIEIIDDGRGLNLEHIKEKALKQGLIKKNEQVTEEKLISCIFKPGLSTAKQVGNLSGRGVGMDVVNNNITALRGSVDVFTKKGKGTTIRIKLPLTLAIIEGMLCRVGNSTYIVPLLSIVESIQPKKEDMRTVKEKGEVVHVRGEFVSFVRLYDYFKVESEQKNPWEALVIIVESGGSNIAIMIDELLGQQQIVIKSLDNYITKNKAVSGAAILGNGDVALILDVHGLLSDIEKNR